ncbi:MAG: SGNH/GDSL hydrolase family protein [Lachnospiraceae bacterium]|nr:SGNH/GDSL hydrolase family protein [Lachnospiraceae bacterium]
MKKNIQIICSILFCTVTCLCGCNKNKISIPEGELYSSKVLLHSEGESKFATKIQECKRIDNVYISLSGELVTHENYMINVYDISETNHVKIDGSMVGNENGALRFAFSDEKTANTLWKNQYTNVGGWHDQYSIQLEVPENAKFLFVASEKISIPSVMAVSEITNAYIDSQGVICKEKNYQVLSYAVKSGEVIEISGAMKGNENACCRYVFYEDEYCLKIEELGSLNEGGWNDEFTETVTVPSDATTLLVSQEVGTVHSVYRLSKEGYTTSPLLKNLKIGVVGDSMAKGNGEYDGNCWPERIAKRNNAELDNQAVNGKYLTQEIWSDSVIGGQLEKLSDDCDVILICAGTNDITAQIPIGDEDSTDTSTLCGTLNVLFERAKEKFPKARIMCITPFERYERLENGEYKSVWNQQGNWINSMAEMCEKWGIPCFNNSYRTDIVWNEDSSRRYFTGTPVLRYGDDYHLNDVGLEYVSFLYEDFIVSELAKQKGVNYDT